MNLESRYASSHTTPSKITLGNMSSQHTISGLGDIETGNNESDIDGDSDGSKQPLLEKLDGINSGSGGHNKNNSYHED